MYEKHEAWKREFGFDCIEMAAEMDEKHSRTSTSPVQNPFFYRNMVIPRHPHTPDTFTLEMKVDVEGLRIKIILSKPASSQCDPSQRRAAVDTGSEEPGTPSQSPAIGTGSEEPGESRGHFKTSIAGFLIHISQARSRNVFCFISQTSGQTTTRKKLLLLHNKLPFARSS